MEGFGFRVLGFKVCGFGFWFQGFQCFGLMFRIYGLCCVVAVSFLNWLLYVVLSPQKRA